MVNSFKQRMELMSSLCRICAQEDKNCIPVFSEVGKQQEIEKKIRLCLPLVIEEVDTLPKQICLVCLTKLDATWELVQLCKNGQVLIEEKLHSLYELRTREEVDNTCPVCECEVLDHQLGVGCEGHCQRWYHCLCVKMSESEYFILARNSSKTWICSSCKSLPFPQNQVVYKHPSVIDDKVRSLSEDQPIMIGDSAIITLVPAVEPAPIEVPQLDAVSVSVPSESIMGMMPTYQGSPSESATTAAPAAAPPPDPNSDTNNVYPQGLIQVLPSSKPVLYQQSSSVPHPISAPQRSVPQPKTDAGALPQKHKPDVSKRVRNRNSTGAPTPKRALLLCKYCKKSFPDEIIDHHVSLHLRQSFFTCIDCNKNFRSEMAMSRHRCGTTEVIACDDPSDKPINLDADDDLICL